MPRAYSRWRQRGVRRLPAHSRPILGMFTLLFGAGVVALGVAEGNSGRLAWNELRARMVAEQLVARGVQEPRVLDAMGKVPRHRFVPLEAQSEAYDDHPLPIGGGQTISQPYVVAVMTELLELQPTDRVLEIGTGSGYQAAILAQLVKQVYSVELVPELAGRAIKTLRSQGITNVSVKIGDGYAGLAAEAPFDAIIVTAAPPEVPAPLLEQLAKGGRLVVPVGEDAQELRVYRKSVRGEITHRSVFPVKFVPMLGEAQRRASRSN